ncbi:MAG TPA: bifunctional demethylmenaquinone methyltransferase/2-methoxy-6-polyprenyl-1,4-benzoquinol methylase UbiE [Pyrinomonadaceae bacterium]|nr:bifunctional demethylmenaquinone methyltransferase/2-methoxy-6-polyprenyl-1,4-benzoquinol methylase UbiE [Pyrinomonadaceae bacterium]HQX54991.1 bifunctional demethylmenaquinone methyltransferase/2-methoxy-6-polyprenyl-1,4-benzoquinol methylase UbiE [Pyrinomonadaceae bacterium]
MNQKEAAHANAVREMFSGIAKRYDLLNHLLSLNIDKGWRRKVSGELRDVLDRKDAVVLDVACGTGDLSIELRRNSSARIIGTDFCRPMLTVAQSKPSGGTTPIPYVEGDALRLPFADNSFDAVTIAFGLRNLASVADGLAELFRIIKPGGRLAVLEFSAPVVPGFGKLFNFYFSHILPRIGGAVSGSRGAYEYLPDSVSKFPDQKRLVTMMDSTGFGAVKFRNLTGGIAALHIGTKP